MFSHLHLSAKREGQRALDPDLDDVPACTRVPLPGPARAIAAGNHHSLALLADGRVLAWGSDEYGQVRGKRPRGCEGCPASRGVLPQDGWWHGTTARRAGAGDFLVL